MPDETEGFPAEPDGALAALAVTPPDPSGVTRWRKKPVTIEAIQLTEDNAVHVADWVSDSGVRCDQFADPARLSIVTLEGAMAAKEGWWVIKGVAGEFYPCDPNVFAATYEPAGSPDAGVTERAATRVTLIDALRGTRQHRWMHVTVLGDLADEVLARLPEAGPDAEVARLRQAVTDRDGEIAVLKGQVTP